MKDNERLGYLILTYLTEHLIDSGEKEYMPLHDLFKFLSTDPKDSLKRGLDAVENEYLRKENYSLRKENYSLREENYTLKKMMNDQLTNLFKCRRY